MSDVVQRLRTGLYGTHPIITEAADEIERLQTDAAKLSKMITRDGADAQKAPSDQRRAIAELICCGAHSRCILEGTDDGCIACDPKHPQSLEIADKILRLFSQKSLSDIDAIAERHVDSCFAIETPTWGTVYGAMKDALNELSRFTYPQPATAQEGHGGDKLTPALFSEVVNWKETFRAALLRITELCPATCDMTLAHEMAEIAENALRGSPDQIPTCPQGDPYCADFKRMTERLASASPQKVEGNGATWEWRGNHLVDRTGQRTLLRDVVFWNITEDEKALILKAPLRLQEVTAKGDGE